MSFHGQLMPKPSSLQHDSAPPTGPAVATASHILDLAMARDPWNCGFARAPYRIRTAVVLPLGIEFEIVEEDKKVRVLRVWLLI
jgi:hypothetical protein